MQQSTMSVQAQQAEILSTTTTTPPPPTPPPLSSSSSSASQLLMRTEKPERNLWREQEMLTVLQIIRDHNYLALLNDKTVRSETVFRNIEKEMNDRGLRKKNFQQIWTKWKFLKSTYMTSRRMHQLPRIIPLDVYEALDELLSAEFRNDGSVSSYDGVDYDDGAGCASSYEMVNGGASASSSSTAGAGTGSNDGLLVISNVQGGVNYTNGVGGCGKHNIHPAAAAVAAAAAAANHVNGARKKIKNGFTTFKREEATNGFGMQHPIFGHRLGVVKDEPIDDEYEGTNNGDEPEPYSDVQLDEEAINQHYPEIKTEQLSPPHLPETLREMDLPPVPVLQLPTLPDIPPVNAPSLTDPPMPPLHRYTPPPYHLTHKTDLPIAPPPPPPLKQIPLVKIPLPARPQQLSPVPPKRPAPPIQASTKKIPVTLRITLRKRKKRLNIPQLSEGTNSPEPSPKHSKISEEDEGKESSTESSRIPFVTYGKAMREMSLSLREIQREMIDEFFKQQMELAKSEHEFQKQQDAMLLRCFEDQTKLLLEGAKRLFTSSIPMSTDVVYVRDE